MTMLRRRSSLVTSTLLLAALAIFTRPSHAQELQTLTPPFQKVSYLPETPELMRSVAGQTFQALTGAITSFGFYGERYVDPTREVSPENMFRAELWAWDGAAVTGTALYASDPFGHWGTAGWFDFSFSPIALTAGASYAAILRDLGGNQAVGSWGWQLGGSFSDAFAQGTKLWGLAQSSNNYEIPADVPQFWVFFEGSSSDLAFRATFIDDAAATVPEPATALMLATGLAALAGRRGRRRNGLN